MKENIIPVFFSFNRNYCIPVAVAIRSMLDYADKSYFYRLYVLYTELKPTPTPTPREIRKILFCRRNYKIINHLLSNIVNLWKTEEHF